jgi:hypothetical protein
VTDKSSYGSRRSFSPVTDANHKLHKTKLSSPFRRRNDWPNRTLHIDDKCASAGCAVHASKNVFLAYWASCTERSKPDLYIKEQVLILILRLVPINLMGFGWPAQEMHYNWRVSWQSSPPLTGKLPHGRCTPQCGEVSVRVRGLADRAQIPLQNCAMDRIELPRDRQDSARSNRE